MVRLLQFALADLDDVLEVPMNLPEQLLANGAFPIEQAIQRILIIASLLLQAVELLEANGLAVIGRAIGRKPGSRTVGSSASHSLQRSNKFLIHAGCCDVCPLTGPLVEVSSSSSESMRILRSLPSSSFPAIALASSHPCEYGVIPCATAITRSAVGGRLSHAGGSRSGRF